MESNRPEVLLSGQHLSLAATTAAADIANQPIVVPDINIFLTPASAKCYRTLSLTIEPAYLGVVIVVVIFYFDVINCYYYYRY